MMEERDRISELPAGILDKILGHLPIEEAARTSILSTIWRNIWSGLTQLKFDFRFFRYIWRECSNSHNCISPTLHLINKLLMQHDGPIRKFFVEFYDVETHPCRSHLFDLDQWLLLVTENGVEEINLVFVYSQYKVPDCIFSCITLRRLHLYGVTFGPINFPCILPNLTLLSFELVEFCSGDHLDCPAKVPMLENLSFDECENMLYCNITAPKLSSFTITCSDAHDFEMGVFLPVNLDLGPAHTIELNCYLEDVAKEVTRTRGLQPPVLNVEHLKLSNIYFPDKYSCPALINLLRICPELPELDMSFSVDDVKNILKFVEELPSVTQTHKMFRTFKLASSHGWKSEMLFIKGILACFPALEKVIIARWIRCEYNELKIVLELLRFPRASPRAKIVYT